MSSQIILANTILPSFDKNAFNYSYLVLQFGPLFCHVLCLESSSVLLCYQKVPQFS